MNSYSHQNHLDTSHTFDLSGRIPTFHKSKNIYANRYKDTSKKFRGIYHLMLKWKGSVIKLVWHDLLVFLVLYFTLSILYRTVFFYNDSQREFFELLCIYASR